MFRLRSLHPKNKTKFLGALHLLRSTTRATATLAAKARGNPPPLDMKEVREGA